MGRLGGKRQPQALQQELQIVPGIAVSRSSRAPVVGMRTSVIRMAASSNTGRVVSPGARDFSCLASVTNQPCARKATHLLELYD